MPNFEFECQKCEFILEDFFQKDDPFPTNCPECGEENCMKKIISMPSLGIVRLSGQDLKNKVRQDAKAAEQKAMKDENFLANLIGEDKYNRKLGEEKKAKEYAKDAQGRPKIKSKIS